VGVTSPQFSKMSVRNSSWTEVQWPPLRRRLFGAAAVTFRGALVDRLFEIHAPFWPGFFFQRRRALDLAGFTPAFHQRRTGWAFVRICSGYSRCCWFLRDWRRRYRGWLRGRCKLEWLFPIEISDLSACSESKSKRQSDQPFHFVPRRPEPARILPQQALDAGGKRNGLERRVADLLISGRDGTKRPFLGHRRPCVHLRISGARSGGAACDAPPHEALMQDFKDWRSAAACGHRSRSSTGQPRLCAPPRRCRVPYRVQPIRNTTSRSLARV